MAGVKGKSGRKKGEPIITQNLIIALNEVSPGTDRKRMLNVIDALVTRGEEGDIQAINTILDRVEGKVSQPTENKHTIDGTLELVKRIAKG